MQKRAPYRRPSGEPSGTPPCSATSSRRCSSSNSAGKDQGGAGAGANEATAAPSNQPKASGGGDFCAVVRDQLNGLATVFPTDFAATDQLKTYGKYLEDTNAKLLAAAPGEIRAALETQVGVSNASAKSYRAGTRPPADVTAQLRAPEYRSAAEKVAAYAKDKCGINPSVTPGG
ncbi:MAG: hypothetical protein M3Y04_02455 [Actinomycetota bacterium]|nr:hypothetical protein [Actinomycetota bacterium]